MNAKHVLSLMVCLGVSVLVVSALGQEQPAGATATFLRSPAASGPVLVQAPVAETGQPGSTSPYQVFPGRPVGHGGGSGYFTTSSWGPSSPEEANLAHEADQLVHQLGEAKSDSDKDKLKTKLSDLLEKQFDQRQKRHESEIEALEAQVKKLKDLVQKRQENRRDIVSKRLDQILRDAQGLGW
jgi:hypothetical protein